MFQGVGDGARNESAVVSVAVHVGGAPVLGLNPIGEPHVTGPDSALELLLNCTIPVGAAPLLVGPVTVAVSVTMPPAMIDDGFAPITVCVGASVIVNIKGVAAELLGLKLLSPA